MMQGAGPSRNKPGGGISGELLKDDPIILLDVSSPRLLVRAE
jgi:hypothetical protein